MNVGHPGLRILNHSIVLSIAAILWVVSSAFGQGFMVKPMKIEVSGHPGETVTVPLELRNTAGDVAKPLDLSLVEVAQSAEGAWLVVNQSVKAEEVPSCFKWVKLAKPSVMVDPGQAAIVDVTVAVPRNARGVYFAGIVAQTRPPEGRGIRVVVRFLIPVIVEIQGRPERQKITLNDVTMTAVPKATDAPGGTVITAKVDNEGRTFPRIRGDVKVAMYQNNRWRSISRVDIKEVGIVPGSHLALPAPFDRHLPSGKYKLVATLQVDGQRLKPLEKEIDFVGDPSATKLAVDTALTLDPTELTIAGSPGSMRTAVLKVENDSDDEVEINAQSLLPPTLRGVALGELKGDDLSGAPWVEISPAKFTLRAGGKQNVRIVANMPRADVMRANYYALVSLQATYPDGQSAGETTTVVCIQNKSVGPDPAGQVVKIGFAAVEGSRYVVQTKVSNTGNVHFKPKCRALLLTGAGQTVTEIELAGDEALMLPMETRSYSNEIDFEKVGPGPYVLRTALDYGAGKTATDQVLINVTEEEGHKAVTVTGTELGNTTQPATQPSPLGAK